LKKTSKIPIFSNFSIFQFLFFGEILPIKFFLKKKEKKGLIGSCRKKSGDHFFKKI